MAGPDMKTWLEKAGEPVTETCFPPGDAPPLPYLVFSDEVDSGGGDMRNLLIKHYLTVERYSETSGYNKALEELFNEAGLKFTREQTWLSDDEMFETIYTIKTPIMERNEI